MAVDIMSFMNNLLSQKLDQTFTTVAVTLILFFYGSDIIRWFVRRAKVKRAKRFVIFIVLALFGTSLILAVLSNLILSIADYRIRYGIIALLLLWSLLKFDQEMMRSPKD